MTRYEMETLGELLDMILVGLNIITPIVLIIGSIFYELVIKAV